MDIENLKTQSLENSVWCFVGGSPCILHPSQIQSVSGFDVRRLTEEELRAMRKIGICSREQIMAEVVRQKED